MTIYQSLLSEVDDILCKAILVALLDNLGSPDGVDRRTLVALCYQDTVRDLAASTKDRKVRMAIERLRGMNFPILSTSRGAGYRLSYQDNEIRDCAFALQRQGNHTLQTSRNLFASLSTARRISEAMKTREIAVQERLL